MYGTGHWLYEVTTMTTLEAKAIVKAQKAAERQAKLVYRGVSYLKTK